MQEAATMNVPTSDKPANGIKCEDENLMSPTGLDRVMNDNYLRDGDIDTLRRLIRRPSTVDAMLKCELPHPSELPFLEHADLIDGFSSGDDEVTPKSSRERSSRPKPRPSTLSWIRALVVDLPLVLLFASLLTVYVVREIHDVYYLPLFGRAQRTDANLKEEFTYYERQCTEADLSTRDFEDLYVNATAPVKTTVDQMLRHGTLVIPQVLQPKTVQVLRNYIVERNAAITDAEAYPVSQGTNRLSYGIDGSEAPAVSDALAEIATNDLIGNIVKSILGDTDPASAEITAITAYAGCGDQVWHADTKEHGNALKYARTYSHSYSLFIPLQDTTGKMGATDICPGTQYCAGSQDYMCEANKMGLHEATPEKVFRAGDGALLNQHVWHRGTAHTDPQAPERIVFIVSFLARPKFGEDPRQLSRGTYFHQKWNMWGHTWKDLENPGVSMRKPFSILRCLKLWKPPGYNYGYDLVTSGFMRFTNEQLEDDDLSVRVMHRLDELGFPTWLRGTILEGAGQKESWEFFINDTIEKVMVFFQKLVVFTHAGYFALLLLACVFSSIFYGKGLRLLGSSTFRLLLTHGLLVGITVIGLDAVRHSKWGSDILSGRTLARPFPPTDTIKEESVLAPSGLTTLPQRVDVLFGTRYAADFLGSYERWLEYHPGNVVLRENTIALAQYYQTYRSLGHTFERQIVRSVVDAIEDQRGRFLRQDFRTGDWRILNEEEIFEAVSHGFVASQSPLVAALAIALDRGIANYRFGRFRGTKLARTFQFYLTDFRKLLFGVSTGTTKSRDPLPRKVSLVKRVSPVSTPTTTRTTRSVPFDRRSVNLPLMLHAPKYRLGTIVWSHFDDEWFPGSVIAVHSDSLAISFEDGTVEHEVGLDQVELFTPLTEGNRVSGCFGEEEQQVFNCEFKGTVLRVMPTGEASILFDDGELVERMPVGRFYQESFRYFGPPVEE